MSTYTDAVSGTPPEAVSATSPTPRRRWRLPFSPWHLVLIPTSFILLIPLIWMLITSFETPSEAQQFPPVLIPSQLRPQNYVDAWNTAPVRALLPQQHRWWRSWSW